MRRFHLAFPIQETVSPKLSWSHYNVLTRVENSVARQWYLQEAINQNWSVRALDRQISMLYYERLLSSKEKALERFWFNCIHFCKDTPRLAPLSPCGIIDMVSVPFFCSSLRSREFM